MSISNDHYFIKQEQLLSEIEIQERVINSYEKAVYENIGQILSLVKMQLFTINLEKVNELQVKINNSRKLIGKAIHDLRYITKQQSPKNIIEKGFAGAIEYELERIQQSRGFETSFAQNGVFFRLDSEKELLVFSIVQELMLDILVLHSDRLSVKLDYYAEELEVRVIYENKEAESVVIDLVTENVKLNERLRLIGAGMAIKSLHGDGMICITIKK